MSVLSFHHLSFFGGIKSKGEQPSLTCYFFDRIKKDWQALDFASPNWSEQLVSLLGCHIVFALKRVDIYTWQVEPILLLGMISSFCVMVEAGCWSIQKKDLRKWTMTNFEHRTIKATRDGPWWSLMHARATKKMLYFPSNWLWKKAQGYGHLGEHETKRTKESAGEHNFGPLFSLLPRILFFSPLIEFTHTAPTCIASFQ